MHINAYKINLLVFTFFGEANGLAEEWIIDFGSRDIKSKKCLAPSFVHFFIGRSVAEIKLALFLWRGVISFFVFEKFGSALTLCKTFLLLLPFLALKIRKLTLHLVRSIRTHSCDHPIAQAWVTRQMNSGFAVL